MGQRHTPSAFLMFQNGISSQRSVQQTTTSNVTTPEAVGYHWQASTKAVHSCILTSVSHPLSVSLNVPESWLPVTDGSAPRLSEDDSSPSA